MSRLAHPLETDKVTKANQTLWSAHSELGGRQLTMGPEDAAYRKEWVDNYLAAKGKPEAEPAAPPAKLKEECAEKPFDCAAAWKLCDDETDAIVSKSDDPVQRNKYFNAAYAKLYLQDPKLEWIGVAAFASKQVGCGLTDADTYIQMAKIDRSVWNLDGPNIVSQSQGAAAQVVYDALSNGNKAVFEDIYPVHLFYEKYGLAKLKQCANAQTRKLFGAPFPAPVDKKVLDGFSDIDAGYSAAGSIKIAQYEQLGILQQRNVFGDQQVVDTMELNQSMSQHWYGKALGAKETSVSFTPDCTGDPSVTFNGTNPADPSQRWPYAQNVVNKFDQLKGTPQIQQGLQQIIKNGQ